MTPPWNDRRDRQILARVAGGDRDALADLFGAHADRLFGHAFALTRCREDAEDLVQGVFVTVAGMGARLPGIAGMLLLWAVRPAVRFAHARVLEQTHETVEYARLRPFERRARGLRRPSGIPQPWWWRRFGSIVVGASSRSIQVGDEHHALRAGGADVPETDSPRLTPLDARRAPS